MKQVLIKNFALLKGGKDYLKIDHCTTFTDSETEIIEFETEKAMNKYIADNKITINEATI